MKSNFIVTTILSLFLSLSAYAQDIIPLPVSIKHNEGVFNFDQNTTLSAPLKIEEYLKECFPKNRFSLNGDILITIDTTLNLPKEGYRLSVSPKKITIVGVDYGGAFNGIQTLRQLFSAEMKENCQIQCLVIEDYPRFEYRGMMLDVARTFFSKEDVLRYIDLLSSYKINRFHWHLTDDEGWRVEIKSHPELAKVGGFRGGDSPIWSIYGKWGERYGGYYTQEDIKEVVEYASLRNVEVIPEIDLPGHCLAIGKVFPEILCPTEYNTVSTAGYNKLNVICAARQENYELIDDILRELSTLFPSKYIHVGGDEVNTRQWKSCPDCSKLYKEMGYSNYHQLEGLFMNRVEEILARYDKLPAVWNESVNGGNLSKSTRAYGWENIDVCKKAASEGFKTVVMPGKYFYFDMKQSMAEPGHTWAETKDVKIVYSFDFAKEGFSAEQMKNVIGVEGAFWSELCLANQDDYDNFVDYQIFPRACALAEIAWTPQEKRSWDDFDRRLTTWHYPHLKAIGVDFREAAPPKDNRQRITPKMTFSSSLKFNKEDGNKLIAEYRTNFGVATTRTCYKKDYLQYDFEQPLECSEIGLITGYKYMRRNHFVRGYVEVSYDGKNYKRVVDLDEGCATITVSKPIHSIRIVSTQKGNGENSVRVHSPIIYK